MRYISAGLLILALAFGCSKQIEAPPSSNTEAQANPNLKQLEWLIGKWVNNDEDISITSDYEWDNEKNFLVQKFFVDKAGPDDDIRGKQIIGWDPSQKKIRSWIFDSLGGFGEGTWENLDHTWYVSVRFTLPDGRRASATHIYQKVDDNTYNFSSQDRDVDGDVLPNVGPFKTIRQK